MGPASDTIVAIASALGECGRVMIRVSGPRAIAIADAMSEPSAGRIFRGEVNIASGISVRGMVLRFAGPRSYTGEDVAELHLPGGAVVAEMAAGRARELGARDAEAGEFTSRAYFNGRIDLTQAEGVAATIAAQSDRELSAARRLAAGELSRRLRGPMDALADTLALIEAGIDFSDEGVSFVGDDEAAAMSAGVAGELRRLLTESGRMERLSMEPRVVLAGRANAGKSTLLNALAGRERAVVSPVAGTTRDAIEADADLPAGRVRLVDTAGVETEPDDGDEIRRQMRDRARRAIAEADVLVLVREAGDAIAATDLGREPDLVVRTKCDLAPVAPPELAVSAVTGAGMAALRDALSDRAFTLATAAEGLALTARHIAAIDAAADAAERAADAARRRAGAEVVAMELREALDRLGMVLGSVSPDDVLGLVFSRFCIGK